MPEINGENLVPNGGLTGAAYVLGNRNPSALSIILGGEKARQANEQREADRRLKRDQELAKSYNDYAQFKRSGSPYFSKALESAVYTPISGDLTNVFKQYRDDPAARNMAARPILDRADMETTQSDAKTKALHDTLGTFQADKSLYNPAYAGQHLAKALHDGDRNLLPSQFDTEAWRNSLMADPQLYNEPEVVARATKRVGHEISQKVANAGHLGGEHTANMVRGKYVRMENGQPVLNADGSPALALTPELQAAFESDPLFKMKLDAREAAYNAQREKDPSLPRMTRRGHTATMIGPFAYYSTQEDEGLNPLPRAPRPTKENPNKVVVRDFAGARQSDFLEGAAQVPRTNHYAEVGQSFGSATKPYVEVSAHTTGLTIIGQDGKPTNTNPVKGGGNTTIKAQTRAYVLYTKSGKRLGRSEPFANDQEAADYALKLVREYPRPQDLELRVEGRGTVEDDTRVVGDGLGGGVPMKFAEDKSSGTPKLVPDNSVRKTEHTVLFPITQQVDEQLSRSTNGAWNRFKHSPAQAELMREVVKRGGKFVSPYTHEKREAERSTAKPQRPAFLQPSTGKKTTSKTTNTNAANNSGGMF